ncbi:MAG TPA: hypothetical protein VN452_09375 [Longilinea sp.]|nr:hypothetical protein [Longilinea sp.]
MAQKPGYLNGKHYSSYVMEIEQLTRENKLAEAEILLYQCVSATEAESKAEGLGVAPYYYDKLALIYRKQKDLLKEFSILERYSKQKHAPGVKPPKLLERFEKVKTLLTK